MTRFFRVPGVLFDLRMDRKDNVNFDKLAKISAKNLRRRNYATASSDNKGIAGDIAEEDLNDARPEWIKRLEPADARWVMVIGLNDVHIKMTFGSTGNAEVIGFLFDKQDGSVVWKGKGIGQAGQGGLLGMAVKGVMSEAAIETAIFNLCNGIPKAPKKGK
jgi:hypothetical protein